MIRVGIIINSARPLQKKAKEALRLIENSEFIIVEKSFTSYPKHAIELAKKWALEKQVIIAVGGDGTCNEVLNGWYQSKSEHCAIGIIPNGTGNDFSRMLPPFDPKIFLENVEDLNVTKIDYGLAISDENQRAFLNISDVGFGAKVVQILERQRRNGIRGKLAYSLAIIRAFLVFRKKEIVLDLDNQKISQKSLLIAFCNGRDFGHGLAIHPDAKLCNGKLGVTIVGNVSILTYASKLGDLKKGKKILHPELQYVTVQKAEFDPTCLPEMMEFDGELCEDPIRSISVVASGLPLICRF